VGATGELGFFKIRHESAVAAGVRRIDAVSGPAAEAYINTRFHELKLVHAWLNNPKDLVKAIVNLTDENNSLKKKLEKAEARQLADLRQQLLGKIQTIGGVSFIGEIVEAGNADALKKLCFDLKADLSALPGAPPYLVVLAANIEGKASVAILLDEQLVATRNLQAPAIIKEYITPLIKGGGGGQKTLATAGGQDASNLRW